MAQVTGLTFTVGDGTSDAAMTFTGTLANINAALARVDYLGNANYSGADTLNLSVDDQGNTGSGGAKTNSGSVAITVTAVNDAPVLTVPSAKTVDEDTLLSITGISVADLDAATGAVKITMSVTSGRLTLAAGHRPDLYSGRRHQRCRHDVYGHLGQCERGLGSSRLPGERQFCRCRHAECQRRRPGQHRFGRREDAQRDGGELPWRRSTMHPC